MCGIVGVMGKDLSNNVKRNKEFFSTGLFVDTLRGQDSTGMFMVDKHNNVATWKRAVSGPDFLDMKKTQNMIEKMYASRFVVGHNRWKTSGAISHHTAHPFQHGPITLVHNGTLRGHKHLADADIDSEAICMAFAATENVEEVEDIIEKIDGAFALVWHDTRDNSLNFVRNEERPFWFGKVKGEETVFFCSEKGMLRFLANRAGATLEEVWQLKEGTYVKYKEGFDKWDYGVNLDVCAAWVNKWPSYSPPVKYDRENYKNPHLEALGLKRGDKVEFSLLYWNPYTYVGNKGKGRMYGVSNHQDEFDICIHDIFKGSMDPGFYFNGEVQSAYLDKGLIVVTIGAWSKSKKKVSEPFLMDEVYEYDHRPKNNVLTLPQTAKNDDPPAPSDEEETVTGPFGQPTKVKYFEYLTQHGCCICGNGLTKEDAKDIRWDAHNNCYCSACYDANKQVIEGVGGTA